jgi:hypothetical protein
MRLNQNIENYLCTLVDVPREYVETCKNILNDFSEFYENCEASYILRTDFSDYMVEVFDQERLNINGNAIQAVLDKYRVIHGYAGYLFGNCIIQNVSAHLDDISETEYKELMEFLLKGNIYTR